MRGDPPTYTHLPLEELRSTPHARGSTRCGKCGWDALGVYPACAGIHPPMPVKKSKITSLPRMRGDPPEVIEVIDSQLESTPHARGSTLHRSGCRISFPVYPACAGIHRHAIMKSNKTSRLPRMRGDPPLYGAITPTASLSTPHARGSTPIAYSTRVEGWVYPACAGIHPRTHICHSRSSGLPRMRGDPPAVANAAGTLLESTPHARGSTPPCL